MDENAKQCLSELGFSYFASPHSSPHFCVGSSFDANGTGVFFFFSPGDQKMWVSSPGFNTTMESPLSPSCFGDAELAQV